MKTAMKSRSKSEERDHLKIELGHLSRDLFGLSPKTELYQRLNQKRHELAERLKILQKE